MPDFKYLGQTGTSNVFHGLESIPLRTGVAVSYISDEVTSVCPVTGQPDWYIVDISLEGSSLGVESKSLKLYLYSLRGTGIFCEDLAAKIAGDISEVTHAPVCVVVVTQKSRGGISIRATAHRSRND